MLYQLAVVLLLELSFLKHGSAAKPGREVKAIWDDESAINATRVEQLRQEAWDMFDHGFNNYMKHAFPMDNLLPMSCSGKDWQGGLAITLVDSLDALVVLNRRQDLVDAVDLVRKHLTFDKDIKVHVFETVIRVLGGLLSGHMLLDRNRGLVNGEAGEVAVNSLAEAEAGAGVAAADVAAGAQMPVVAEEPPEVGAQGPQKEHLLTQELADLQLDGQLDAGSRGAKTGPVQPAPATDTGLSTTLQPCARVLEQNERKLQRQQQQVLIRESLPPLTPASPEEHRSRQDDSGQGDRGLELHNVLQEGAGEQQQEQQLTSDSTLPGSIDSVDLPTTAAEDGDGAAASANPVVQTSEAAAASVEASDGAGVAEGVATSGSDNITVAKGSVYDGIFLRKAVELADLLLPAFDTPSGLPALFVHLKNGSVRDTHNSTCTACAGTLLLEFGMLTALTGNPVYLERAEFAARLMYDRRSRLGLVGASLNVVNSEWASKESTIGPGSDSYYEYLLKAYLMFGKAEYLHMFADLYASTMRWMQIPGTFKGYSFIVDVHMDNGRLARPFVSSLGAFWPGMQALAGQERDAIDLHANFTAAWRTFGWLPEVFGIDLSKVHPEDPGYNLRPEHIESTYLLHCLTQDPYYLRVAANIQSTLATHNRVQCGYTNVNHVDTGEHGDLMESYFLSETAKYLYLMFSAAPGLIDYYVLSTEGHLIPPLPNPSTLDVVKLKQQQQQQRQKQKEEKERNEGEQQQQEEVHQKQGVVDEKTAREEEERHGVDSKAGGQKRAAAASGAGATGAAVVRAAVDAMMTAVEAAAAAAAAVGRQHIHSTLQQSPNLHDEVHEEDREEMQEEVHEQHDSKQHAQQGSRSDIDATASEIVEAVSQISNSPITCVAETSPGASTGVGLQAASPAAPPTAETNAALTSNLAVEPSAGAVAVTPTPESPIAATDLPKDQEGQGDCAAETASGSVAGSASVGLVEAGSGDGSGGQYVGDSGDNGGTDGASSSSSASSDDSEEGPEELEVPQPIPANCLKVCSSPSPQEQAATEARLRTAFPLLALRRADAELIRHRRCVSCVVVSRRVAELPPHDGEMRARTMQLPQHSIDELQTTGQADVSPPNVLAQVVCIVKISKSGSGICNNVRAVTAHDAQHGVSYNAVILQLSAVAEEATSPTKPPTPPPWLSSSSPKPGASKERVPAEAQRRRGGAPGDYDDPAPQQGVLDTFVLVVIRGGAGGEWLYVLEGMLAHFGAELPDTTTKCLHHLLAAPAMALSAGCDGHLYSPRETLFGWAFGIPAATCPAYLQQALLQKASALEVDCRKPVRESTSTIAAAAATASEKVAAGHISTGAEDNTQTMALKGGTYRERNAFGAPASLGLRQRRLEGLRQPLRVRRRRKRQGAPAVADPKTAPTLAAADPSAVPAVEGQGQGDAQEQHEEAKTGQEVMLPPEADVNQLGHCDGAAGGSSDAAAPGQCVMTNTGPEAANQSEWPLATERLTDSDNLYEEYGDADYLEGSGGVEGICVSEDCARQEDEGRVPQLENASIVGEEVQEEVQEQGQRPKRLDGPKASMAISSAAAESSSFSNSLLPSSSSSPPDLTGDAAGSTAAAVNMTTLSVDWTSWATKSHEQGPCAADPPVTLPLVIALPIHGCERPNNPADLAGAAAVVVRGGCSFVTKVHHMQDAGASAVIVLNLQHPTELIGMAPDDSGIQPVIPAVLLGGQDGRRLLYAIRAFGSHGGGGPPLVASLSRLPPPMVSSAGRAAAAVTTTAAPGGGGGTCAARPSGGEDFSKKSGGDGGGDDASGPATSITTRLELLVPGGSQAFLSANVLSRGRTMQQLFEEVLEDGRAVLLLQQIAQKNARQVLSQMEQWKKMMMQQEKLKQRQQKQQTQQQQGRVP